jgi:hypothetical protein
MGSNGFGSDAAAQLGGRVNEEARRRVGVEPGRIGGGLDEAMEDVREQLIAVGWASALLAGIGVLAFLLTRKRSRG